MKHLNYNVLTNAIWSFVHDLVVFTLNARSPHPCLPLSGVI